MVVMILAFIGCIYSGYLFGTCDNDDSRTKILGGIIVLLIFGLSIMCFFSWREVYKDQILQKHYNIVQEITTTTTYKIIPNG